MSNLPILISDFNFSIFSTKSIRKIERKIFKIKNNEFFSILILIFKFLPYLISLIFPLSDFGFFLICSCSSSNWLIFEGIIFYNFAN
jgi:hypothetical protein